MVGSIVEVADDRRHLFMHGGFMVVQDTECDRTELGQGSFDNIAAIIAAALQADADPLYIEDLQHNKLIAGTLRIVNPFLLVANEG